MSSLIRVAEVWRSHLGDCDSLALHEVVFFPIFARLAKGAGRILEIGAGRGRMVKVLRKHGVKGNIVCLDINDYVKEAPGVPVVADARLLPFKDGSFDLVYSLGVVEHFKEMYRAISEHVRVTKKEGHILITTPRISIYTPLRWIVWFLRYRKKGGFKELMGSNLSITRTKKWLEKCGGDVRSCGASGYFLPGSLRAIGKYIEYLLPHRYLGAYLWCLARKT